MRNLAQVAYLSVASMEAWFALTLEDYAFLDAIHAESEKRENLNNTTDAIAVFGLFLYVGKQTLSAKTLNVCSTQ